MGELTNAWYRAKTRLVRPLRLGHRRILWTQNDGLGFGNFLYLWMHAHLRQELGEDYRTLRTAAMRPWARSFPAVDDLLIDREDTRFVDKREWGVNPRLYQRFGVDYTREDLRGFITSRLLPSSTLDDLPDVEVAINIRRGDYYSRPDYRARYGMDLSAYVSAALAEVDSASKVVVVSDDPAWCQEHLKLPGQVDYLERDPVEHFRTVCAARTLIGTNSTFSYWGGYIGDVLRPGRVCVMPAFHKRGLNGGFADQLDPRWTAIRTRDLVDPAPS